MLSELPLATWFRISRWLRPLIFVESASALKKEVLSILHVYVIKNFWNILFLLYSLNKILYINIAYLHIEHFCSCFFFFEFLLLFYRLIALLPVLFLIFIWVFLFAMSAIVFFPRKEIAAMSSINPTTGDLYFRDMHDAIVSWFTIFFGAGMFNIEKLRL